MPECTNGHEVPAGKRFCGQCGVRVESADSQVSPPPPDAEHLEPQEEGPGAKVHWRVIAAGALVVLVGGAFLLFVLTRGGDEGDEAIGNASSTTTSTTSSTTTTPATTTALPADVEPVGGLTPGVPEGLPSTYETLGFPMPTPSSVTEIRA